VIVKVLAKLVGGGGGGGSSSGGGIGKQIHTRTTSPGNALHKEDIGEKMGKADCKIHMVFWAYISFVTPPLYGLGH